MTSRNRIGGEDAIYLRGSRFSPAVYYRYMQLSGNRGASTDTLHQSVNHGGPHGARPIGTRGSVAPPGPIDGALDPNPKQSNERPCPYRNRGDVASNDEYIRGNRRLRFRPRNAKATNTRILDYSEKNLNYPPPATIDGNRPIPARSYHRCAWDIPPGLRNRRPSF